MKRGELARAAHINPETLRYYEQTGLLAPSGRSEGGYRIYSVDAVQRIHFIKRAQAAGFTLEEIKGLLAIKHDPHGTSGEVRERVQLKLADIDQRIAALMTIRQTLTSLMEDCPGGDQSVDLCPILEHFDAAENASSFTAMSHSHH